jgi:DNA polymerase-3 subunit delta
MKLKTNQIEPFLRQPDPAVRVVLVYGADTGLVRERARGLVQKIAGSTDDPFRIAQVNVADLREDPARLADELASLSMIGGARAIWLRQATNGVAEPIATALETSGNSENVIIVEAGELGPRDALRKTCESAQGAVAIPCYVDDERSLDGVVRAGLAAHGLDIEPAAMGQLIASLGADRGVTRQEIEKLALYTAGDDSRSISVEDVAACVGDGAPMAREDVALATLSGDQGELDRALERCWSEGESPVGILRSVSRHIDRLHLLAVQSRGGDPGELIKKLRPPVFWKHQPILRGQLRQWTAPRLGQALNIVAEAEIDCKTTGMPAQAVCHRALMRIAQAARAGGRR